MSWHDDQKWEAAWWGTCANTFGEETKQITYAHRMGLQNVPLDGHWPVYDVQHKRILDIGGGPTSLLLKTVNLAEGVVIDPCRYPAWVAERYRHARITYLERPGENPLFPPYYGPKYFDECWIYNCLQHTLDPRRIIENARTVAKAIRIFEWIDREECIGHPQTLRALELDQWLDGTGIVENMKGENGCVGPAYYGYFAYGS
jgi:hypothetical protein